MRRAKARFLLAAAMAAAAPALAQNASELPRVGWISVAGPDDAETSHFFEAFRQGLRDLGYVDGDNLVIEPLWARGSPDRVSGLARQLVRDQVDVIVSHGAAIRGVREVAGSVPVVFAMSADPVLAGLVESLARPDGMFTGVTFMSYQVNAKRLELLKEALPEISRIALLTNPEHAGERLELEASRRAADVLGLELSYLPARSEAEVEAAFAAIAEQPTDAIVALPDALMMQHRQRIIDFAAEQGIPAISGWPMFARSGGMMTYGPSLEDSFQRLAHYVDQILKGARPGDLPVEQPTTFELVVNLSSAKKLGIDLPRSILVRADEVIE